MITWAGGLIAVYGTAHTLAALTVEGAGSHADTWFSGGLWGEGFSPMSPAMSAYWFSVNSFGPPFVLIGLLVLWLDRRGITPPAVIAWALAGWFVVGEVVGKPGLDQDLIILAAAVLLLVGAHRAHRPDRLDRPEPHGPADGAQSSGRSEDATSG